VDNFDVFVCFVTKEHVQFLTETILFRRFVLLYTGSAETQ